MHYFICLHNILGQLLAGVNTPSVCFDRTYVMRPKFKHHDFSIRKMLIALFFFTDLILLSSFLMMEENILPCQIKVGFGGFQFYIAYLGKYLVFWDSLYAFHDSCLFFKMGSGYWQSLHVLLVLCPSIEGSQPWPLSSAYLLRCGLGSGLRALVLLRCSSSFSNLWTSCWLLLLMTEDFAVVSGDKGSVLG